METVDTSKRLAHLRALMKEHNLDVYSTLQESNMGRNYEADVLVVPSEDSHQSEYIAPCDARRGTDKNALAETSADR